MKPIEIYDKNNVLVINWTLNSICTYHCSYCPDSLHRGTNTIIDKLEDQKILENFLIKLKDEVKDRPVHIFLNGGEPTISPHFEFLCDKFNEYKWYCHVNTNGTRSMSWWTEHAPKLYKVTLSYHPEWDNTDIFEKMDAVGKITNTGVFVLMWPPLWDKCVEAYNKFKAMDSMAHVGFTRVFKKDQHEQDTSYDYSAEQLLWFEKEEPLNKPFPFSIEQGRGFGHSYIKYDTGEEQKLDDQYLLNNRLNRFYNWACNIGNDCLYISFFGRITGASCGQGQYLGTIEDFKGLAKMPVRCKQVWCSCALETNITKKLLT
jgi:organic radical activating enzyme